MDVPEDECPSVSTSTRLWCSLRIPSSRTRTKSTLTHFLRAGRIEDEGSSTTKCPKPSLPIFPAPKKSVLETLPAVEWTRKSHRLPGVRDKEHNSNRYQRQPATIAAFAREKHHSKHVVHGFHTRLLCYKAWFMEAWSALSSLRVLLEEALRRMLGAGYGRAQARFCSLTLLFGQTQHHAQKLHSRDTISHRLRCFSRPSCFAELG